MSVPYATVPSDGVLASIFASVSNVEIVNPEEPPAVAVPVAEPPMTMLPVADPDAPVPRVAVALPLTTMLPVATGGEAVGTPVVNVPFNVALLELLDISYTVDPLAASVPSPILHQLNKSPVLSVSYELESNRSTGEPPL